MTPFLAGLLIGVAGLGLGWLAWQTLELIDAAARYARRHARR